jgi:hypothetical protein
VLYLETLSAVLGSLEPGGSDFKAE